MPDSAVVMCTKIICMAGALDIIQLAEWVHCFRDTPCCYGKATGDNDCDGPIDRAPTN